MKKFILSLVIVLSSISMFGQTTINNLSNYDTQFTYGERVLPVNGGSFSYGDGYFNLTLSSDNTFSVEGNFEYYYSSIHSVEGFGGFTAPTTVSVDYNGCNTVYECYLTVLQNGEGAYKIFVEEVDDRWSVRINTEEL